MKNFSVQNNLIEGDLKRKAEHNLRRMNSELYDAEHCFKDSSYLWYGDWEGRTILSLVRLWQVLKRKPRNLDAIIAALDSHLNTDGYFGAVLDEHSINEQQLAGNSWVLRGLCEYYRMTRDASIFQKIVRIVENLYLPVQKHLGTYPLTVPATVLGEKSGGIIKSYQNWQISSDIGCFFIALDGLSDAYAITQDPRLKELIEALAKINFSIDKVGNNYQTHATLTCARGILRMYRLTGKEEYLAYVIKTFALYTSCGMSFAFGNFNWFNRGEWTEPCAIVDSMMLADELYCITGNREYLSLMHKIYYNAFVFAQRDNGGFGCDSCVKSDQPYLMPDMREFYEAYWCCTMRAAEGFYTVARSQWKEQDGCIYCCFYNPSKFVADGINIALETKYPNGSEVRVVVHADRETTFKFYIPQNTSEIRCSLQGYELKEGYICCKIRGEEKFILSFVQDIRREYVTENAYRIFCGERLLGTLEFDGAEKLSDRFAAIPFEGKELYPVLDLSLLTFDELKQVKQKLLFRDGENR